MTHNPLIPIAVGNTAEIHVSDIGNVRLAGYVAASDIPALIAVLSTLAREMGAGVPDPVPVIEGLLAMTARVECQDEGDRAKIDAARAYLEKVKK